jgi:hypothetical protein
MLRADIDRAHMVRVLKISKACPVLSAPGPLDYVHLWSTHIVHYCKPEEEMQELLALALAAGAAASPFEKSKWHFEGKPHGWYVQPKALMSISSTNLSPSANAINTRAA